MRIFSSLIILIFLTPNLHPNTGTNEIKPPADFIYPRDYECRYGEFIKELERKHSENPGELFFPIMLHTYYLEKGSFEKAIEMDKFIDVESARICADTDKDEMLQKACRHFEQSGYERFIQMKFYRDKDFENIATLELNDAYSPPILNLIILSSILADKPDNLRSCSKLPTRAVMCLLYLKKNGIYTEKRKSITYSNKLYNKIADYWAGNISAEELKEFIHSCLKDLPVYRDILLLAVQSPE